MYIYIYIYIYINRMTQIKDILKMRFLMEILRFTIKNSFRESIASKKMMYIKEELLHCLTIFLIKI